MYVHISRRKKTSFADKFARVRSHALTLGLLVPLILAPAAAFARGGVNNPPTTPTTTISPTFSIAIATTSMANQTITISGSASIYNFSGREDNQYIKFIWGDGQTNVNLFMNFSGYLKSSGNMSLANLTASHSYAADQSYVVTAKVYHGDSSANEIYPSESSTYTVKTENTELACLNSGDDDRDSLADLRDPDCAKFKKIENTATLCSDGFDNDANGMTDLNDANCAPFIPTEDNAQACSDGIDNDLDGRIDLLDSGCAAFIPTEDNAIVCADGIDNDLDGKIDLYDTGCAAFVPKENTNALCTDGIDNDLDGAKDGADTDCAGLTPPENTAATCLDAIDNDFDGKVDWNDPDCAAFIIPANCPVGFVTFFIPGFGFICAASAGY